MAMIAPADTRGFGPRPWEGAAQKKPWDYDVTVAIPTLNALEGLSTIVELYRLQSERPYIMIIDTGSTLGSILTLESIRADDVEIHYVRAHGYQHPSAVVTTALDVAHALCRTPYLLHTHADVFPVAQHLVERLKYLAETYRPVVGYEMSDRAGRREWQGAVSHTLTMLRMDAIREAGVSWSWERYLEGGGAAVERSPGFPDTEQPFEACLREARIEKHLIGRDDNGRRKIDEYHDHVRGFTGLVLYAGLGPEYEQSRIHMADAIQSGQARIASWRTKKNGSAAIL